MCNMGSPNATSFKLTPLTLDISSVKLPSSNTQQPKAKLHGLCHRSASLANPSISLTKFASQSPPSSPSPTIANEPALSSNSTVYRRRHRQKRRLARPKDAMSGYSRRWSNRGSKSSRSKSLPIRSAAAAGGSKHLDRNLSTKNYFNSESLSNSLYDNEDELQQNEVVANDALQSIDSRNQNISSTPICPVHELPTDLKKVKKKGTNHGRTFFACNRASNRVLCDFFQWADVPYVPDNLQEDYGITPEQLSSPSDRPLLPPVMPVDSGEELNEQYLVRVLQKLTSHQTFRPGQLPAIQSLLRGNSTMACLSTGAGKTLIYQLFACIKPGLVIVVSPLVSLLQDQLVSLPDCIKGACLRFEQSEQAQHDIQQRLLKGDVKVLFISPERLFANNFRRLLAHPMFPDTSLLVVDEAHCVSQWSHHFRVAYLRIKHLLFPTGSAGQLSDSSKHLLLSPSIFRTNPLILALTATATSETLHDVCESLKIDPKNGVFNSIAKRENLRLTLSRVDGGVEAKAFELVRRLKMDPFREVLGLMSREKRHSTTADLDDGSTLEDENKSHPSKRRKTRLDDDEISVAWGSNRQASKSSGAMKYNLASRHKGTIIIYVTKQRDCDSVYNYLRSSTLPLKGKIAKYHAGMFSTERTKVQGMVKKGSIAILVATVAFGMGLNYSNICGVIHFDPPSSLEQYSQEIGRAGRDGKLAYCHMFFNQFDLCRMISRSHADEIDKSCIRQLFRKLPNSKWRIKRSRSALRDACSEGKTSTNNQSDHSGDEAERDSHLTSSSCRWVVGLTEEELNTSLDLKLETAETVFALLEQMTSEFRYLGRANTNVIVQFFSQSPHDLIRDDYKGLNNEERNLIDSILKYGKVKQGKHNFTFSDAGFLEGQVIRSLKSLSKNRHISFELNTRGLQLETTELGIQLLEENAIKYADDIHYQLTKISNTTIAKARVISTSIHSADQFLTDDDQSQYLQRTIMEYFASSGVKRNNDECDGPIIDEKKKQRLQTVIMELCSEKRFGNRPVRSSREIARILHGINSAGFQAKDWFSCRHWGQFVDVSFELTMQIAMEVLRKTRLKPTK